MSNFLKLIVGTMRDLGRDTRAGVMIMMAFSLLALAAASGAAIDFARGLNFKLALQGAVDAASLAGATEYLNTASKTKAKALATSYIANALDALPPSGTVTTKVTATASGTTYTVVVTASASITSSFLGVIENQIPVSVTATAKSSGAPNIDFYLLLDSSPSMAIAATSDGIATMVAHTQGQCDAAPHGGPTCGCAFACHESQPSAENYYPVGCNTEACKTSGTGNPSGEDNFALARNLGVPIRMDLLTSATSNLISTALTTEASNNAVYRMGIYTFTAPLNNASFYTYQSLTPSLALAQSVANTIQMLKVYSNNCLTSACSTGDTDTDYTGAMTSINSTMQAPGNGTNAAGDKPQAVLFLVTDGVEDEMVGGSRVQSLMDTSYCTTIKNRGIRIAVLYTEYLPLPTNGWYNTYISPFQDQIDSNMQSCASPGLYFKVNVDGDISAAMSALFNAAVKTAYISQ